MFTLEMGQCHPHHPLPLCITGTSIKMKFFKGHLIFNLKNIIFFVALKKQNKLRLFPFLFYLSNIIIFINSLPAYLPRLHTCVTENIFS